MARSHCSNNTLLSVLDAQPTGTLLITEDARVVLSNAKAEQLFDYDQNELIGMTVKDFLPEKVVINHEKFRLDYMKNPCVRAMNEGRVLSALKKDGEEILLQFGKRR